MLSVMNDNKGNVYVAAEHRHRLFNLCERLGRGRNMIRWSHDLRCYVIVLSTKQGKEVARAFSK